MPNGEVFMDFLKNLLSINCTPPSREELFSDLLPNNCERGKINMLFLCAGTLWTLWKTETSWCLTTKWFQRLTSWFSNWRRVCLTGRSSRRRKIYKRWSRCWEKSARSVLRKSYFCRSWFASSSVSLGAFAERMSFLFCSSLSVVFLSLSRVSCYLVEQKSVLDLLRSLGTLLILGIRLRPLVICCYAFN